MEISGVLAGPVAPPLPQIGAERKPWLGPATVPNVEASGRTPDLTEGTIMGLDDKIKNAAQEATGKAKEAVGDATDNERLEAEGHADRTEANLKQAGENVKDAFK